jgi:hypothetical protein
MQPTADMFVAEPIVRVFQQCDYSQLKSLSFAQRRVGHGLLFLSEHAMQQGPVDKPVSKPVKLK